MSISSDIEHPKFEQLVSAAKDLFYRFGIKRVTVEEICQTAGVSKMTFYKFFSNKLDLAKYLVTSIFDAALQDYVDIIESDKPFPAKLKELIELKRRGTEQMGSEFMAELVQNPEPEIAEIYQQQRERSLSLTMNFLKRAQKNGDIRADLKLEFLLYLLNKMVDMSADEALLKMYPTPQELALEMTNFFFYGILNRD